PKPPPNPYFASSFYDTITARVRELKGTLKDHEELVGYYYDGGFQMRIALMGYANPMTIILKGFEGDNASTLLVHVASANIVFNVSNKDAKKQKTAIGFIGQVPPADDEGT